MRKFKVGDRIVRTSEPRSWMPLECTATVLHGYNYEDNGGAVVYVVDEQWELVEDTSKHHIHHDLIIAWAKGATIGHTNYMGHKIGQQGTPTWCSLTKYHIVDSPTQTDAELIIELRARIDELEGEYGP